MQDAPRFRLVLCDYGPFDAAVYSDAERLEADNEISITSVAGKKWRKYVPTADGTQGAQKIEKQLLPEVFQYIHEVVDWVMKLSFQHLIRTMYREYPEFKVNSVFQG